MKKRFTEEQIAYALKRHETGIATKGICREMGVSDYNVIRPDSGIGNLSPAEFAERFNNLASEGKNLNLEAVQFQGNPQL